MEDEVKETSKGKSVSKQKIEMDPKPIEAEVINLESFVQLQGLEWQTKSRLEYYITVNKLSNERLLTEWQALLKKV